MDSEAMMTLAARTKSEKLAVNLNRMNQLLEELDEICIASTDAYEIEDHILMTERLYLETEILQTKLVMNVYRLICAETSLVMTTQCQAKCITHTKTTHTDNAHLRT
ncbi:hypothetical protein T03_5744 [Trichinella britovi]|uniref:Uncharacterized protein n=1 Tax=Trichinella britovi TaxID=45882 RepID=A0A0V1DAP9_TRIBR|nr:hypothetical protein T03_5744 [Trichinella britovi]